MNQLRRVVHLSGHVTGNDLSVGRTAEEDNSGSGQTMVKSLLRCAEDLFVVSGALLQHTPSLPGCRLKLLSMQASRAVEKEMDMIQEYDKDFFEWTQATARAIEAGRFYEIDRAALADEVESLGKRDRREVGNRLGVIVVHLLKLRYRPDHAARSWYETIEEQRGRLTAVLKDSPSLHAQVPALLSDYYVLARRKAARQTGLPLATFREPCEWTGS